MNYLKTAGLVIGLAIGGMSCNELAESFDCFSVCDTYTECYDNNFDVSECTMSCEDEADLDEAYALSVNECQTCLDASECTAAFDCATECANIVP